MACYLLSRLLKVAGFQHCVAHSINLLLMTDSLLKVGSVTGIVRKCKDIVNVLHYKSDMLEREVKDTNNELDRSQKSTGKKLVRCS